MVKFEKSVYSALYNYLDGMFTSADQGDTFQISRLDRESNEDNIGIEYVEALQRKLFPLICNQFNRRKERYELTTSPLNEKNYEDLKIIKPAVVYSHFGQESSAYSGECVLFPRTFVCRRCGTYHRFLNEWKFEQALKSGSFNPGNCTKDKCGGKSDPMTVVGLCENGCGHIRELSWRCSVHGSENVILQRPDQDNLKTWKFRCGSCKTPPTDVLHFQCRHDNGLHNSKKKPNRYAPIPVREGRIASPVTITKVDLPRVSGDPEFDDWCLLGIYLEAFSQLIPEINDTDSLRKIFEFYKNDQAKSILSKSEDPPIPENDIDKWWKEKTKMNLVEKVLSDLMNEYSEAEIDRLLEYHYIKDRIRDSRDTLSENNSKLYKELSMKYGISEISYISNVRLVIAAIGVIFGYNKWWEEGFVPHFEPLWQMNPWTVENRNRELNDMATKSYVYPFLTEGILLDFSPESLVDWLIKNGKISHEEQNPRQTLLSLEQTNNDAYVSLYSLLHTISHVIINQSTIYTGLDQTNCGEMIFPDTGSIFIYSTSQINTGGFQHAFNQSLNLWFNDIKANIQDCSMDPICIKESGACFSCLFLPEFVCTYFNKRLNRDTIIGTNSNPQNYSTGFWE